MKREIKWNRKSIDWIKENCLQSVINWNGRENRSLMLCYNSIKALYELERNISCEYQ